MEKRQLFVCVCCSLWNSKDGVFQGFVKKRVKSLSVLSCVMQSLWTFSRVLGVCLCVCVCVFVCVSLFVATVWAQVASNSASSAMFSTGLCPELFMKLSRCVGVNMCGCECVYCMCVRLFVKCSCLVISHIIMDKNSMNSEDGVSKTFNLFKKNMETALRF